MRGNESMTPTKDFWEGVALALIIFAFMGPLAYCTVQGGSPTRVNDLIKVCIEQRGTWTEPESWTGSPHCKFPEKE